LRYIYQHIQTITANYDGSLPLTHYLKQYFRQHPKLGSRDRKALSQMAYCYYRTHKGLGLHLTFEETIQAALLLCNSNEKYIQPFLPQDAIALLHKAEFDIQRLFPYDIALSDGIEWQQWLESMLVQPDMFIRIRVPLPVITAILGANDIPHTRISDTCIALPNGSPVDKLLPVDSYVVQDASSQYTGNYFKPLPKQQWWDCCSGAGGKSLLVKDKEPGIQLTVSDKRATILHNLQQRFKQYHLQQPAAFIADMTDATSLAKEQGNKRYDSIICDVPCTGSGTWARTPEQLYFFGPHLLDEINALQMQIAPNAATYLKPGGTFYYITCSVFQQENEVVVAHLLNSDNTLKLQETQLINGLSLKADSMFIAVIKKED
jgi:16S rRNA (cytosine967-C5)-methyltransferase